jgi:hypothetical protein
MPRWFVLATSLVLSLPGCTFEQPPVRGDVTFTAEERADIEWADVWIAEQIGREPMHIVWDLPHTGEMPTALELARRTGPTGGAGFYAGLGITLDPDAIEAGKLRLVAAHEIAHFHGYHHHPGPGVLSDNYRTMLLVWTPEDAASLTGK